MLESLNVTRPKSQPQLLLKFWGLDNPHEMCPVRCWHEQIGIMIMWQVPCSKCWWRWLAPQLLWGQWQGSGVG